MLYIKTENKIIAVLIAGKTYVNWSLIELEQQGDDTAPDNYIMLSAIL